MARAVPQHDWYLPQWLATLGIRQARLMELTDWDKRKTSQLLSGKQRYNRDTVNEAAFALHLSPFELLMHPDDAMAIRRMRQDAMRIAAERNPFTEDAAPPLDRTGTEG